MSLLFYCDKAKHLPPFYDCESEAWNVEISVSQEIDIEFTFSITAARLAQFGSTYKHMF